MAPVQGTADPRWVVWLCLVCTTLLLLLLPSSFAISGSYVTNDQMANSILDDSIQVKSLTPVEDKDTCTEQCQKHATCDAFSYSGFYRICKMYSMNVGSRTIPFNTYQLYVREKTTDEGFFKYGTTYVKMVPKLATADEGDAMCKKLYGGELLPIKEEGMNTMITDNILMPKAVFQAFIGVTDKEEENTWTYRDGSALAYENWDWNGVWPDRKDLNCAYIKVDGTWKHTNCFNKFYFLCKVPMF